MLHKPRVGVVRGGPSNEYEVSLNTGANVLNALSEFYPGRYQAHDILIDKNGNWFFDGTPVLVGDLNSRIDVAFNALHGAFGEDGKVQHIFEAHGLPFTGSGALSSAMGMNKRMTKDVFIKEGIQTPRSVIISGERLHHIKNLQDELYQTMHLPVVIKPVRSGSSVGVSIVKTYRDIPAALLRAIEHDDEIMAEDYIKGIEATCGIVDNFRGEELYALPPVEIRPKTLFFDYDAKYAGQSDEIVPATFAHKIKEMIQEISKKIHRVLGLRHYSRSDFIIHPKRGIYALEVNTLPGLTDESLLPKSLRAVGSDTPAFIDHIITLAITR